MNSESKTSNFPDKLTLIASLSARLCSGGRFEDHIGYLTKEICHVLDTDVCVIRELKNDQLVKIGTYGVPEGCFSVNVDANVGIANQLLGKRLPIVISNTENHPVTSTIHHQTKNIPGHFVFKSFAGAPMFAQGEVVGILAIYTIKECRDFTDEEISLLQILANSIGMALANDELLSRVATADLSLRIKIMELLDRQGKSQARQLPRDESGQINHSEYLKQIADTHQLEYDLRHSELDLINYYQPIYCTTNASIVGHETLLRWKHPRLGLVGPDKFIPLAEETGLISNLCNTSLRIAAEAYQQKRLSGLNKFLTINLSVVQLMRIDFALDFYNRVTDLNISPESIILEITESAVIERHTTASRSLVVLAELGFSIFIDDFGAGFSSLRHLIDHPIQGIKIDKAFMPRNREDRRKISMMTALTHMAQDLGLKVVAEGVEEPEQIDMILGIGVDYIQGYAIGFPTPS